MSAAEEEKQRACSGTQCWCPTRMEGKTVVITGATAGLGLETAKNMAVRGAKVIMAVRNLEKASTVIEQIISETGNRSVIAMRLDLASLQSVADFAAELKTKEDKIDVLLNNAGVFLQPKGVTVDGNDYVFQSNYLGHFLLTILLLDLLERSAPCRVINVSSDLYKMGSIKVDDLNNTRNYRHFNVYADSKLEQILFTKILAKKLKDKGVSVFAVHPGAIATDIVQRDNVSGFQGYFYYYCMFPFVKWFGKSVKEGAQTQIHCCVAADIEEHSGAYFADCKVACLMAKARDDVVAQKLWELSMDMVKQYVNN